MPNILKNPIEATAEIMHEDVYVLDSSLPVLEVRYMA